MQVKLKIQVRIPYENKYLNKGTKLEVIEVKGNYYICSNEDIDSIFIQKELCEVEEGE